MMASCVLLKPEAYGRVKRAADLGLGFLGFVVSAPIIVMAALAVWLEDGSASPFLRQERLGRREEPFHVLKLRTMRTERFREGMKLTDAERLLWTGKIFRKLSIDELPQVLNVLKGDMSLIGPRPMPVAYRPYFRPEERVRFSVHPGMSGLAQVKGRNFLTWDEKFLFDIEYVEKFGPLQDLRIFFLTLGRLLVPTGVGTRGEDIPVESLHEVRSVFITGGESSEP